MIYLMAVAKSGSGGGRTMEKQIILMEKEMIEDILKGCVVSTPDGRVLLGYAPDPEWVQEELRKCNGDVSQLIAVIAAGVKREHVPLSKVATSMTVMGTDKDGDGQGQIYHEEGPQALDLMRQFQEGLGVKAPVPMVGEKIGGRKVDVERVTKPSAN